MTYTEASDIITKYAPEVLSLFADPWERWPEWRSAVDIQNILVRRARMYDGISSDVADSLRRVSDEIGQRIQ